MPTQTETYDAIVIGVGAIGGAALYHLAKRGLRVLGIEQFEVAHSLGSSHGQSRMIRQAYFENPNYVPLVNRAFDLWEQLEQESKTTLLHMTGLIEVGPPDGITLSGVTASAREHNLNIERWSRDECMRELPQFWMPEDCEAIFETKAGCLLVEPCVATMASLAMQHGANLQQQTAVREIESSNGHCTLNTDRGQFSTKHLVVTAGAWTSALVQLPMTLEIRRKHMEWYAPKTAAMEIGQCPAFFFETNEGYFYGLPSIDHKGVKVAEHSGGEVIVDPSNVDRSPDPTRRRRVDDFVATHLPQVTLDHRRHAVCMYTMSRDEHFILDRHPDHENIVLAAGLSGHGFKFAPVLGEVLADWVVDSKTDLPVNFLSLRR